MSTYRKQGCIDLKRATSEHW